MESVWEMYYFNDGSVRNIDSGTEPSVLILRAIARDLRLPSQEDWVFTYNNYRHNFSETEYYELKNMVQ